MCESLESITIPDSVTSIGNDAFGRCKSLKSVTIGGGVTSIGNYAFYLCESLESVYYRGFADEWANVTVGSNNDPLTSATVYYYIANAEDVPTDTTDKYWYYKEDGSIGVWGEDAEG